MESYGLTFRHDLVVEHVRVREPWTESDQGRIIYEHVTQRCYVGQLNDCDGSDLYSLHVNCAQHRLKIKQLKLLL